MEDYENWQNPDLEDVPEVEDEEQGMFEHFRLNVDAGQVPIRIDKFMSSHLEDTSRHRIQCAIKEGFVKVGDKTAKANLLVRPGDLIRFVMPYRRRGVDLVPQNIPLDIVYEDEDVLVVNKPAGMVVHPGHGHFDGTLINALLYHLGSHSTSVAGLPPSTVSHALDPTADAVPPLSRGWRRSCEAPSPCTVSIDLITGVPGMTIDILEKTVEEILEWRPEHISAYQLSIEEGSTLALMIERGEVQEQDEDCCREQYEFVCRRLAQAGYKHYEISNWAIPGHEALHNSAYWTRHPYAGLGPGAHSLIFYDDAGRPTGGAGPIQRRSWNSQSLSAWERDGETLNAEQIHEEEVMLLARTSRGPIPEKEWFIADDIIPDLL